MQELRIGDIIYRTDCYDIVREIKTNGIIGEDSLRGVIPFRIELSQKKEY